MLVTRDLEGRPSEMIGELAEGDATRCVMRWLLVQLLAVTNDGRTKTLEACR